MELPGRVIQCWKNNFWCHTYTNMNKMCFWFYFSSIWMILNLYLHTASPTGVLKASHKRINRKFCRIWAKTSNIYLMNHLRNEYKYGLNIFFQLKNLLEFRKHNLLLPRNILYRITRKNFFVFQNHRNF